MTILGAMSNAETTAAGVPESAEAEILRVLRGNPNPAEVAALIVTLAHVRARNAAAADPSAAGAAAHLPTAACWDRPRHVDYCSAASWMHAA